MDKEKMIAHYMETLKITREEALDLYECDFEDGENEEQEALEEKAKTVKIDHGTGRKKAETAKKPRIVKISEEKQELFQLIKGILDTTYGENVQILKENKLISVKIAEKTFKIDLVEERIKKK